jgi:hypothetical protein
VRKNGDDKQPKLLPPAGHIPQNHYRFCGRSWRASLPRMKPDNSVYQCAAWEFCTRKRSESNLGDSNVTNLGKAILNTRDEIKAQELKLEFNNALLDLHEKQLSIVKECQTILAENEAMKKQLAAFERWDQESARYQLHQLVPGILVYALKSEFQTTEPAHWLCPACYQDKQKSILHRQTKGSDVWICPRNQEHRLDIDGETYISSASPSIGSRRQRSLDG